MPTMRANDQAMIEERQSGRRSSPRRVTERRLSGRSDRGARRPPSAVGEVRVPSAGDAASIPAIRRGSERTLECFAVGERATPWSHGAVTAQVPLANAMPVAVALSDTIAPYRVAVAG